MASFTLKILDIRTETSDTKTLCLKQPGLKKIKYFPGQYLTLVFRINGRKYSRPYSFSSAPGVDEHIEITVKRISGGVVSNHVNDVLQIGDLVEVMPPMGDFIFNPETISADKHIILWGAGSGITPLISIAKYILNKTDNRVTLVYGNKNSESVIFNDKIKQLRGNYANHFKAWHFHSQLKISEKDPEVVEGRIKPEKVLSIMANELDLANTIHYICGPVGLKESVKTALKALSVADDQLFFEDFEIIKDPKDFYDVTTQFVELFKNNISHSLEVVKGKSILETGLDAGLDLDYSCQTGSCHICVAKLLSGNVKMIGLGDKPNTLLADECLLCCSYPLSGDICVSV